VIPSDHKWFTRVAIADILVDRMNSLRLEYPRLSNDLKGQLRDLRAKLTKT
jgi:hypothetical protein